MIASTISTFALFGIVLSETFTGDGTFFGANSGQGGACALFDPIPAPQTVDVVAMNTPQYDGSAVCGACVSITGAKGTAIARVVDRCPECAHGALDMSEELFPKIDDPAKGRVPISWSFVPCPDSLVSGPIEFQFIAGSNESWMSVQVRNHKVAVKSLEVQGADGSWVALQRTADDHFTGSGLGAGPFSFKVTSVDGASLTEAGIAIGSGGAVKGTQQF